MSVVECPAWPSRVGFDEPFRPAIAREIGRAGARRPFVIASATLARDGGPLDAIRGELAGLWTGIGQHSPQPDILAAADAARACGADAVVSIGGGSVIDAAKLVQAALGENISSLAGLAEWRMARKHLPALRIPHLAVPTTLSCAEFTWFAGARNPASGLKDAFAARWMMPSAIMFDPALALHTPLRLWLSTGLRAIDHAIETLFADRCHPLAETLCIEGLGRMLAALDACAAAPEAVGPRKAAQTAAWLCAAGLMSGVPMGASHALGHVIGSLFDMPHGLASCVMLPAVIEYNGAYRPDRLALLSAVLGPEPGAALRRRIAGLGLPTRLSEVGVDHQRHAAIIDGLSDEAWLATNPRPLGPADVSAILQLAA